MKRGFLKQIKKRITSVAIPITGWEKREAYYREMNNYEYIQEDWNPFSLGSTWSEKEDVTTFFRTDLFFPEEYKGEDTYLVIDTGGEATLFINGNIYHGLDENHKHVPVDSTKFAGQKIELLIEAALNRINKIYVPDPNYKHCFKVAELRVINKQAEEFYFNLLALIELIEAMEKREKHNEKIKEFIDFINLLEAAYHDGEPFTKLNKLYNAKLKEVGKDETYRMACFGHAHIDVAWLWQFKETRRKAGRTFSTAVKLMDEYPGFKFIQSQPLLYHYIKRYYPSLYNEIKEKIKAGQWQPEGAMWVEADTNLPAGESLVRQFLYGKKFLKEEFGFDSRVCWLPDVFGYTGSLPQIMKKAEVDYFMTSKISWNDTNEFPYAIFHWEGIDGTRVLTHIPRVILPFTYNGEVYADKILKVKENYEEQKKENVFDYKFGDSSNYFKKDRVIPDNKLMYIYGYGDGGGGVTKEFIEKIKRFDKLPFLPHMDFSQPKEYFIKLEEDMLKNGTEYPTWRGELYFEYHRGTYTSQAKTKKNNRRAEVKLREAEILNTLTGITKQHELQLLWEDVLTNQFHDIIPGTSIHEVYQDVERMYSQTHDKLNKLITSGLNNLVNPENNSTEIENNTFYYIIWNSRGYSRSNYVDIPFNYDIEKYQPLCYDTVTEKELKSCTKDGFVEVYVEDIPPVGYRIIKLVVQERKDNNDMGIYREKELTVENQYYKLLFEEGNLISIYDKKHNIELIPEGKIANELHFFEDKPPCYEAWEQVAEFEEKRIKGEVELVDCWLEETNLKKTVNLTRKFRDSTFKQKVVLYNNTDRIDFVNEVDWVEREIMVKTAFPVNINSDRARYEIAYGNLTRPTTNNTDYEKAQFEVPGHRWVDLSQPGLGVSLINDCKYGYDVKGNLIRLTLLKAPNYPDEKADYGQHIFTYSLYSHDGIFFRSKLFEHADALTYPPVLSEVSLKNKNKQELQKSFLEILEGNARLGAMKEAENGQGWILRFYEPYGGNTRVKVRLADDLQIINTQVVNLLESPLEEEIEYQDNKLIFDLKPFEIKTIKLKRA